MSDDTVDRDSANADDWFPLDELTQRLAGLAWVEQQLADVFSGWVETTPHAATAVAFARAGDHHRWHSELLVDVLATSPQLAAGDRIGAPTEGWGRAIGQLRALDATEGRMAAIVRLIAPWFDREIASLRDLANPLSDRDHDRILGFVSLDHQADHEELTKLFELFQDQPVDLGRRREIAEIDLR